MAHQMTTRYLGNLKTEGQHLKSGNIFITSAPPDNQGLGDAYSPTDAVCAALSACMITIMGIAARKDELDIVGLEAEVTKVMTTEPPRKIAEIHVHFTISKEKSDKLSDKHKLILERAAYTCPVALSLHPEIKQVITFNWQ